MNAKSFVDYKGRPKSSFPFKKSSKIKNIGISTVVVFRIKILKIKFIYLKQ